MMFCSLAGNSGQVIYTHGYVSCSIIWCWPKGGDALQLRR